MRDVQKPTGSREPTEYWKPHALGQYPPSKQLHNISPSPGMCRLESCQGLRTPARQCCRKCLSVFPHTCQEHCVEGRSHARGHSQRRTHIALHTTESSQRAKKNGVTPPWKKGSCHHARILGRVACLKSTGCMSVSEAVSLFKQELVEAGHAVEMSHRLPRACGRLGRHRPYGTLLARQQSLHHIAMSW